jgi:ABC-2 type transport system ATP-binding protein
MKLTLNNVNYEIDNKNILKNINLSLTEGIHALLGLNGAGKTSLINLISTLKKPSNGDILFNDKSIIDNPELLQQHLGFISQNIGLIQDFTVEQNLIYFGMLKGCNYKDLKKNLYNIYFNFDLTSVKNTKILNLSGGLKQRIGIALALINSPKILILDEPLNNLDFYEREKFYFILKKISKDCIIIISTHLIDEIENISDTVIFIKEGNISFHGSVIDSIDKIKLGVKEKTINHLEQNEILEHYKLIKSTSIENNLKIRFFDNEIDSAIKPTFEDSFFYYTKFITNE